MAVTHLIHGFLGVGKTTYARRLERERSAVRFTHDEWMARLYGVDSPADLFADRAARVSGRRAALWTRCRALGMDVVLDEGFWSRARRDRLRALVPQLGGEVRLYRLWCPDDVARDRIARRNLDLDGSLHISPATNDALRTRFEALGGGEPRIDVGPDPDLPGLD